MRWLSVLFLCVTFYFPAFAADVELVRVWPQWRSAESFERIGEFLGLPESNFEPVMRTQPGNREGLYFVVRVKTPAALEGAKFVLELVRPDGPEPKSYSFPITLKRKSTAVHLGLTGTDWPGGRDTNPVAWRVALVDAQGRELAAKQSFLWAKPVQ